MVQWKRLKEKEGNLVPRAGFPDEEEVFTMSEDKKIIRMDRNQEGGEDPREQLRIRVEFVKELRKALRGCYQKAESDGEKLLMQTLARCMDDCLKPGPKKTDAADGE